MKDIKRRLKQMLLPLILTLSSGTGIYWLYETEQAEYQGYYDVIEKLDHQIEDAQRSADEYRNMHGTDDLRFRVDSLRDTRRRLVKEYDEKTPFSFEPF